MHSLTKTMRRSALLAALLGLAGCGPDRSAPDTGEAASGTEESVAPEPTPATPSAESPAETNESPEHVEECEIEPDHLFEASDADIAAFAQSNNAFADALWPAIGEGNQVFSPASIQAAFAMAYSGAEGETREQMATALRYASPEANRAAGALLHRWRRNYGEHLSVANRLFGAQGYNWRQSFLDFTRDAFNAPLEALDFQGAPEQSRQHINHWVETATHDRISNLLPGGAIDGETRMVLVNAVHFEAEWAQRFQPSRTADAAFQSPDGPVQVPMMFHPRAQLRHGGLNGFELVELPYEDRRLSMVIAVPWEGASLRDLEAGFSAENFALWMSTLTEQSVALRMPKFRVAPDLVQLGESLQNLGMQRAFSDGAQFGGMFEPGTDPLKIDEVFHKAFIDVHEAGTEAAAATAIVMARSGRGPGTPEVEVTVDRPFLFFLRDNETNAILFMGRVVRPEVEGQ